MDSLLYKEKQFKYLSHLVGAEEETLKNIIENIDAHCYEYAEEKKNKLTGEPKRYSNGASKKRVITPSRKELKKVQRGIKRNILDRIAVPEYIQGGVRGRSNITNAKMHQGKKFRLVTDLMDFFPTVPHKAVYSFFLSLGYSNHIAGWLTRLTTWKGKLPQGASTSLALANFCFAEVDQKLIEICQAEGLTYTRFVDDLTFSAPHDFREKVQSILHEITIGGYKINQRKTEYGHTQTVTGLLVNNNYIDVPTEIKEKARLVAHHNGYQTYMNNVRNTNKNMTTKKELRANHLQRP